VTQLVCGGIFNNHLINRNLMVVQTHSVANLTQSVSVKEFLKNVNIWPRYGQNLVGTFYGARCIKYEANRCTQTNEGCSTFYQISAAQMFPQMQMPIGTFLSFHVMHSVTVGTCSNCCRKCSDQHGPSCSL